MGVAHSRKDGHNHAQDDDSFGWPSPLHKSSMNIDYRLSGPLLPDDSLPSPRRERDTHAADALAKPKAARSKTSVVSKLKGAAKVNGVGSLVGKAKNAGLGKAVEVLDTLGSSMASFKHGSSFTSGAEFKGNKIEILSFEVANTIMKGYNIRQSLSKESMKVLKEDVLCSEGVQRLVSMDMTELLSIVAADKKKELMVFAKEVVRFGNQCRDPQWHLLDRYFEKLGKDIILPRQNVEEAEAEMEHLVALAQQTAELYHELNSLDRFETEIRRKLQDEDLYNSYTRGEGFSTLRNELRDRRNNVKHLKKKSLWSKNLEEVIEKLVDMVYFLHLEVENAFGDAVKSFQHSQKARKVDSEQLGPLGLALHYACIINHIDGLVSRPGCLPADSRDNLYQSLPIRVKVALRRKVLSLRTRSELTLSHVKAEMEKILAWLVPIAIDTTKAHHGFGWVGEWANTGGSTLDLQVSSQAHVALIQTLHYADRRVTEEYILELVVLLHHFVSLARDIVVELKSPLQRSSTEGTETHIGMKVPKHNLMANQGMHHDMNVRDIEGDSRNVENLALKSRGFSSGPSFEDSSSPFNQINVICDSEVQTPDQWG